LVDGAGRLVFIINHTAAPSQADWQNTLASSKALTSTLLVAWSESEHTGYLAHYTLYRLYFGPKATPRSVRASSRNSS
jgi:hypothetical protein